MRRATAGRGQQAAALLMAAMVVLGGCGRGESAANRDAIVVPDDPAVVHTQAGAVRGTTSLDHRYFAGIPYAAPPVGPLRWQPPDPVAPWDGFRDATRPGAQCVQDISDEDRRPTGEDCLTLNVWTPPPSADKRPVMVWIHGGSFLAGSGDIYNSRRLAGRGDMVVVTINYRLGALGFLAHPALGQGNYGLADQQAALRWVRDNIAEFGGDPDQVTIAGESAGGMSVCDHLVSPESEGLFRAAIVFSGPCQAQVDLPAAEKVSMQYGAEAGCADAATAAQCLRALPVDKLQRPLYYGRIGTEQLSGPVTGTSALPVDPMRGAAEGRAAKVPVMIGTTADEFNLFTALQFIRGRPMDVPQYPELLAEAFGANAPAVAQHYPPDRFGGSVPLAFSTATTDGVFACVADELADALAKDAPVYSFVFDDPDAPAPEPIREAPFPIGAAHSLELRYLFDVGGAPPLNAAQERLSEQMIDYVSRFVATGSPGPDWPRLTPGDAGERMSLQPDGNRVVTSFEQTHQCPFWASLKG